jgi:hypothetical protein
VALETDVQRIGRELAESFPARARNPLKAMDERAMELASRDMELRAALFRLVDVTPACRSLDDLARHLASTSGRSTTGRRRSPPRCAQRTRARVARRWERRLPPACGTWRTASSSASRHGQRSRPCGGLHDDGVLTTGGPARRGDRVVGGG